MSLPIHSPNSSAGIARHNSTSGGDKIPVLGYWSVQKALLFTGARGRPAAFCSRPTRALLPLQYTHRAGPNTHTAHSSTSSAPPLCLCSPPRRQLRPELSTTANGSQSQVTRASTARPRRRDFLPSGTVFLRRGSSRTRQVTTSCLSPHHPPSARYGSPVSAKLRLATSHLPSCASSPQHPHCAFANRSSRALQHVFLDDRVRL